MSSGLIVAKGGGPGFNLRSSSKPPSIQTSKLPFTGGCGAWGGGRG